MYQHSIILLFFWIAQTTASITVCKEDSFLPYPSDLSVKPCYSHRFKNMVFFGDSWTDNGNSPQLELVTSGYYPGRMANGPIWPEYLTRLLGLDNYDFAFSGATANNSIVPRRTLDVQQQIEVFEQFGPILDPNETIYVIWTGVNDVVDIYRYGYSDAMLDLIDLVVDSIKHELDELQSKMSARALILMGLAPIQHLPLFSEDGPEEREQVAELVNYYNSRLQNITTVNGDEATVVYISTVDFFNALLASPTSFGFRNVETSCQSERDLCKAADERYLWWDDWHPTTFTHRILAEAIQKIIENW